MPRVPKAAVIIDIPAVFRDFMRHVAQRIADGGDAATTIESDDLLQCDCIFGGLCDIDTKRFRFCYFHDDEETRDDDDEPTWDIVLDISQIQAIADGSLTRLNLWQCSGGSCDCLHATEDSYCTNCDSIRHFDDDIADSLRAWYPDEPESAITSLANLRRIVMAILDYAKRNGGRMPPPFTTNRRGDRLHSWRSLILPFLDLDDLHAAIDFRQPWHAPVNSFIAAETPEVFRSTGTKSGHTRYSAIIGPETLWPPKAKRKLSDVTSGFSFTIAVVESPGSEFRWMEPSDVDFETLASQLTSIDRSLLVAMIGGNANPLTDVDVDRLRELVTI